MSSLKFKNENGEWQRIAGYSSVAAFNGRAGVVRPQAGDYTAEMVGADTVGAAASALEEAKAYANEQIALIPTPDVSGQINVHNVDENAHADIREAVTQSLVDAKAYADELSANAGSGVTVYEAVIGTTWTEDSETGVKSQNVAIEGVLATHTATVDHVFTAGTEYADFVEAENQYLEFITNGYAETYDGGVTFHIFGKNPTVEIPIVVGVV